MKRFIRVAMAALTLALTMVGVGTDRAEAWDIDAMNKTVNQTNFVLDNQCSATLISVKHKLVLTNYHCVDHKISVIEKDETMANGTIRKVKRYKTEPVSLVQKSYMGHEQVGSSEYLAEIVAHDKGKDLAVVQIKADTITQSVESKILPDGKKLVRGEKVWAVGNPLLLDATVSEGVISSLTRTFDFPWLDGAKLAFIQFTAPITGGNSGGALYNDQGELIGVPAAGTRDAGDIGLAVPVSVVKQILKRACYGQVYGAPETDDQACLAAKEAQKKKLEAIMGGDDK